ncbi:MAG: hypothetical protein IJ083_12010 [Clostridia bacterium]|nr:hypothetical protein [Clostridia bacterium]
MSIVLQHDSRTHITYAYHNDVTWIKDEKRSHQKRTLIGRISPETGEIIPTTGNRRKNQIDENVIQEEIAAYNQKIKNESLSGKSVDRSESNSSQPFLSNEENEELREALINLAKVILKIYDKQ